MRILYITHNYPRFQEDYSGFFIKDLAQELASRGHEITVLAPHFKGARIEEKSGNLTVYRFRYGASEQIAYTGNMHGLLMNPLKFLEFFSFINSTFSKARELASFQDIIHVQWLVPSGIITSLPVFANKILTLHGTDVRLLSTPVISFLSKKIIEKYSKVTAVSEFLKKEIAKWGYREEAIVLPMTGNLDKFINYNKTLSSVKLSFLTVGRLSKQKNIETALRAMSLLKRKGIGFQYTIVGEGEDGKRLQKLSDSLSLSEDVLFKGSSLHSEIPGLLNNHDIFIVSSLNEGLGISSVEAMLSGLLVIGSRSGSIQYIIDQGKSGYLFDPLSPQDLSEKISNVHKNREIARQIAAKGRERAVKEFSFSSQADRWEKLYYQESRRQSRNRADIK